MATPGIQIMRARLENDTTLRSRAFFGRATVRGLARNEYTDLLAQLSHYLRLLAPLESEQLVALAVGDLGGAPEIQPCAALRLAEPLFCSLRTDRTGFLAGLAVVGTSWAMDTADASRAAHGTIFLRALNRASKQSLERLHAGLDDGSLDRQVVHGLVEIMRGVVLGIASYLDTEWSPPVTIITRDRPPSSL